MQTVKWRALPLYEGFYEINEAGQIKSLSKRNFNMILTQRIDRGGYYTVRLSKRGQTTTHWVHRLLATTYIPNLLNKPEVNHKDSNKLNNALENLEWVTHAENIKHAYDNGVIKPRRGKNHPQSIPVIIKLTGERFDTIKELSQKLGKNYESTRRQLRTNRGKKCFKVGRSKDNNNSCNS